MTGVVLAGGLGRRLGGAKAVTPLRGRAMVLHPLEVLGAVCPRVAVVAKPDTAMPRLPAGVSRWDEPRDPRHPLTGIVHALARAGEPVLVCAADMPFVTAACAQGLLDAAAASAAPAVVAEAGGRLEPLLGVYRPAALDALSAAPADAPLTDTVAALGPARVPVPAELVRSVNTPADLAAAEAELAG